jgi:hypothetical protein
VSQIPTFRSRVSAEGDHKMAGDERDRLRVWLKTLRGKDTELVIRERKSQRSLDQNAWIWGVAYPVIAEALGYDSHEIEELHYGLVAKWGGEHFDKRLGAMVPNKRSSKLTTKEFSDYMEWLVRFAAVELGGIVVPLPGESEAA